MKTKFFALFLSLLFICSFVACSVEIREPEPPAPENISEPEEQKEATSSEEPEIPEEPHPLDGIDVNQFISFEEITALGYYPLWMQPNTVIIYDENGIPEIIEGGVITEDDSKKDEFAGIWYFDLTIDETMKIKANTKVEYFTDGFIQNIYFLWPDGSYNLSPFIIEDTGSGYMPLEDITAKGFYPLWMRPNTVIIYDENGIPEIIEGGELSEDEIAGRDDIKAVGFTDFESPEMKIAPETKAEYDLHGFIQNIYYLWPDGSYNLSPFGN